MSIGVPGQCLNFVYLPLLLLHRRKLFRPSFRNNNALLGAFRGGNVLADVGARRRNTKLRRWPFD